VSVWLVRWFVNRISGRQACRLDGLDSDECAPVIVHRKARGAVQLRAKEQGETEGEKREPKFTLLDRRISIPWLDFN